MEATANNPLPAVRGRALNDLEQALRARTDVSEDQARRLRELPMKDLEREVRAGAEIVKRLGDAVAAAMYEPREALGFLEALDLRFITRDHDWRSIFATLREQAGGDGQRERVALWNYLAYLCSRRDLVDQVVAQRRALEETLEQEALELEPEPRPSGIVRLPKGETVIVKLPYRGELTVYLGRHAFTLVDGYPPRLLDPEGGWQKLRRGSQTVGRHPACDLVTWADFGDVSRAHLEIDWRGDLHVAITDRSSRGTFVDAEALATGPVTGPCAPDAEPCRPAAIPGDGMTVARRHDAVDDDAERPTVVRRTPAADPRAATRFHRER